MKVGRGGLETGVDCPGIIRDMLTITRRRKDDGWYIEVTSIGELLLQRLIIFESEVIFQNQLITYNF
jgi:hypothetical protein